MLALTTIIMIILSSLLAETIVSEPGLYTKVSKHVIFNTSVLQIICSTNKRFLGCSAEILVNEITFDDIRYVHDACYHKSSACIPEKCRCSVDCKEVAVNITVQLDIEKQTLGCKGRIEEEDGRIFKARKSVKLVGEDFTSFDNSIYMLNISSVFNNNEKQEPKSNNSAKLHGILIPIGLFSLLVLAVTICLCYRRSKAKDRNSTRETERLGCCNATSKIYMYVKGKIV